MNARPILASLVLLATFSASQVLADTVESDPVEQWTPSPGDEIHFDVLRKGNPFGTHTVRFDETPSGELQVISHVDLRAGLGPITVFRYQLDAAETWSDGHLVEVEGEVNDDGKREQMSARRDGDELIVNGDGFSGSVPGDILPASHWNMRQVEANRLLSTEDGELLDVTVSDLGRETIEAGGQMIEAHKYLMDSDIDVTLWYDDTGRWVKLAFTARGQDIEYVLTELY